MKIRKIKQQDNKALALLIRQVFDEFNAPKTGTVYSDPSLDNLYELFYSTNSVLWVAEINEIIIGCCGVYPTDGLPEDCVELVKFYLSENCRGIGVGKALLEKCFESAKTLGYA